MLTSNHTKSCGCLKLNNLIGKRFGRLIVINKSEEMSKYYKETTYECKCDCGNIKFVRSNSLVTGNIKSCGCIRKEVDNLSGLKFGELTVLRYIEKKYYKNSSVNIWQCKCSCGNIINVQQCNLKNNNTMSCGCINKSHGEIITASILNEWNFKYIEQYRFENCKYKYTLPFDFALLDNNGLIYACIEYDGEDHFLPVRRNNITLKQANENYKSVCIRDKIKNDYCYNNKIPLIRVPYWINKKNDIEEFLFDEFVKCKIIIEEIKVS
jgi:hypothetical protein